MPQNLKPLTALRFFAAMWVVTFHYWPDLGRAMPAVIARGYLGVELFFVLSGFILSHVYLKPFGQRRFSYPDFLWARLARIYPVHLATLLGLGAMIAAAAMVGVQAGEQVIVWPSLPAQLTLSQAWGLAPHGGWNHPAWSISAEWFAYIAFPLFAWAAWRLRARSRLATAGALVLVAVFELGFSRIAGFPLTQATIAWGALRIVPCFALGCAVYLLWSSHAIQARRRAVGLAAGVLAAIGLGAQFRAPDWLMIVLFGALLFALASQARAGSRILTAPILVYLGEVSFSLYMVCIPWQMVVGNAAHALLHLQGETLPAWLWVLQLLGVTPAAMAVHHLVERPARAAMRRHGVPFIRQRAVLRARIAQVTAAA